jgi:VanZ family protein
MESGSPRRNRALVALALIAAVYWLAMFAGTHFPLSNTPTRDPYSLDKWLHAAAFAGLAMLLAAVGRAWGFKSWKLYAGVIVVLALYALFDETTQALVWNREADVVDWFADLTGTLLGIAAFALAHSLLNRNRAQNGED